MEVGWQNNPFRPFCSERCQLIDLAAWASEAYRIPEDQTTTTSIHDEDHDTMS